MIRNKPAAKPYYRLLAIGLLVIAGFQVSKFMFHLSDFVSGLGMGAGLGLELVAFVKIKRLKKGLK